MQEKVPVVYIMANKKNGTIYTGVTSNLLKRIFEHKNKVEEGFTSKYDCLKLIYYEVHENMESAITREKQLKAGSRQQKLNLIKFENPEWNDLSSSLR